MGWTDEEDERDEEVFQTEVYLQKMNMVFIRACELLNSDNRYFSEKTAVRSAISLLKETEEQMKEYKGEQ